MTDTEALILLNQSMILTALSSLLKNKELYDLVEKQAERSKNEVLNDYKFKESVKWMQSL